MADIEKVINGHEHCIEKGCFDCPYFKGNPSCMDDLGNETLELLKEYKSLQPLVDDLLEQIHETAKQFRPK